MLFNSFHFLVFFPIVVATHFLLPYRWQIVWLLAASCYFYMALIPVYILVLFALILIDYGAGLWIQEAKGHRRKTYLIVSLVANVAVLGFFKYYNFFNANLGSPFRALDFVLPIGLSFHTFQSMAYTIEVYRGRHPAERNLWRYALYVLFWPQLVAGPIERPQNLLPQLKTRKTFDYDRVVDGLRLMLIGFLKKCLIADRMAMVTDAVYANPGNFSGPALVAATFAFSFQIYYDFSGYSDIAIGAARVCGYDLMRNFRQPYLAQSVSEFWQRWHISLSTWFRDYLYIPLGGNKVPRWRHYLNLMIVFVVSGFWHGAQWTFMAWGALHGIYLVTSIVTRAPRERIAKALCLSRYPRAMRAFKTSWVFTLASFAWIFFRAASMSDALLIVRRIFSWGPLGNIGVYNIGIALAGVAILSVLHANRDRMLTDSGLSFRQPALRWASYCALAVAILVFGRTFAQQTFIYFQF